MMNLPNILTLSRIVFAGIMVFLLVQNALWANLAAVVIFVIAAITDFYDGYLAKRQNLISDFGKIMDPIADKVLILSVFGVFAYIGMVAWWMVGVIALREIAVTVSRLMLMREGKVVAAEKAGKVKTVVQMAAICVVLAYLLVEQSAWAAGWFYKVQNIWLSIINIFMLTAVVLTIASGLSYFRSLSEREK